MEIRKLREAQGVNQTAFARQIGVDQSTLSLWESGRKYPAARRLPLLADLLDCSIDALYGREWPLTRRGR